MADTAIAITAGTGTNVDTRTEGTNGNHRQVIVIGDPATNAGVAPVDATNGLSVAVTTSALPTGASTAAKQPALGTAGTASTDVISVQGIASMTPVAVVGKSIVASSNFNRPADTTAYAVGDLVANNTTAGSVTPLSWTLGRVNDGYVTIRRARLKKSTTGVTNAQFRLHLFGATPTVTNGDNGAWLPTQSTYLGWIDITLDKVFSDAAEGIGVPTVGSEIIAPCLSGAQTIKGLLEARAAYTPGNAETFTVEIEALQD
jgi:hypothetical protein